MHSISIKTLSSQADLGLIFDTDVDRSAAVDHRGREISRNGIVAMAAALLADDHPGTTVVTDSITSDQLNVFLEEKLGMKHLRYKRGYKNVINKAIELNEEGIDCQLAIETSGHAALKENYFLDDGAYLATKIVIKAAQLHKEGKKIADLIRNSSSHWSYVGSSRYSYIGIGVEYRAGAAYGWYGCVMVGTTNYG